MTDAYTYKVPAKLGRKLKKGETVVVQDSQLTSCGYIKVARTCKTFVETVDGRRWRPQDGHWLNEEKQAYPFPSIKPVNLRLIEPDRPWLKRLKANGYTADTVFDAGQHEALKKRLLNMAGVAVVLPVIEEDLDKIMSRAFPLLGMGRGHKLMKGENCKCHRNSALLWEQNPTQLTICTGYALSEDSVWRQHSWCLLKTTDSVVETTVKRRLYFGFRLTETEANEFLFANE